MSIKASKANEAYTKAIREEAYNMGFQDGYNEAKQAAPNQPETLEATIEQTDPQIVETLITIIDKLT